MTFTAPDFSTWPVMRSREELVEFLGRSENRGAPVVLDFAVRNQNFSLDLSQGLPARDVAVCGDTVVTVMTGPSNKVFVSGACDVAVMGGGRVTCLDPLSTVAVGDKIQAFLPVGGEIVARDHSRLKVDSPAAIVSLHDNAIADCSAGQITAHNSSRVIAHGTALVQLFHSSSADVSGSAQATVYGASRAVVAAPKASVHVESSRAHVALILGSISYADDVIRGSRNFPLSRTRIAASPSQGVSL